MNSLRNISVTSNLARLYSRVAAEFVNRNPRNLEKLRIARKPDGYYLDKPGKQFWHKLQLTTTNRTVTAQVVHYLNGPVVEAKTSEWALHKHLYSMKDTCAYINLGRVFAERCLESGIIEMFCDIKQVKDGKVEKFLIEVSKGGVRLKEPHRYIKPHPWDRKRPEKPWEVTVD